MYIQNKLEILDYNKYLIFLNYLIKHKFSPCIKKYVLKNLYKFSAIYIGCKLAVEARSHRCHPGGGGDPVPGGDQRRGSLLAARGQERASATPLDASDALNSQLRPASGHQLGFAIAVTDTWYVILKGWQPLF